MGQAHFVVVDSLSRRVIPFANVFTADNGLFLGTTSDGNGNGNVTVNFSFNQLTISHIDYEQVVIYVPSDSVRLLPKNYILSEVTVKDDEPLWVRHLLNRIVEVKSKLSRESIVDRHYHYMSRNVSDSSGYWFENSGVLRFPVSSKDCIRIRPSAGYIHYKDKSAGCDFTNLKRMLYHDFIQEFDSDFLRKHTFRHNEDYHAVNNSIIQIYFKSNKYGSQDKGYMVVDTVSNSILSVVRDTDFDYNIDNNTNSFTRATVSAATGWKYTEWKVRQEAEYQIINGAYFLVSCKYKAYLQSESDRAKYHGKKFDSFEAEVLFDDSDGSEESGFTDLLRPWYVKIIVPRRNGLQKKLCNPFLKNIFYTKLFFVFQF